MNRFGMWAGMIAVWGALLLTGCGGDDDDEAARPFFAPIGLMGQTYNLMGNGGPTSITFADAGNTYAVTGGDAQVGPVGPYSAVRNSNLWRVRVTTPDGRFTSELILNFTGPGRGNYRFTEPGWLESVVGTFEQADFAGNPDPGGGTTTGGGGGTGTPVTAPDRLNSLTLTENPANPSGRTTVTFAFTPGTTGNFTTGARSGTFVYTPLPGAGGSRARLRLDYLGLPTPDFEEYTLTFFEANNGSFTGTQRVGLSQGPATGTFVYTSP